MQSFEDRADQQFNWVNVCERRLANVQRNIGTWRKAHPGERRLPLQMWRELQGARRKLERAESIAIGTSVAAQVGRP